MKNTFRRAVLSWGNHTLTLSTREFDSAAQHVLQGVPGWWGGVGVRGDNTERELNHGLFPEPSLLTGREITLMGALRYDDALDRDMADRYVSAILGSGVFGTLTVTSGEFELTAMVKRAGAVSHKWIGQNALSIQVPLLAPDPYLYGPEQVTQIFPAGFGEGLDYPLFSEDGFLDFGTAAPGSSVPIHNRGNAIAWPKITVNGSFGAGFRITSGTSVVEYPAAVYSTAPVTLDMATGSASTPNGGDQTHVLSRRGWFGIPPGGVIKPRIRAISDGTGWADIHVSDTYE